MYKYIDPENMFGKIIKKIVLHDQFVILSTETEEFTVLIGSMTEYHDVEIEHWEINNNVAKRIFMNLPEWAITQSCIMTQDEYNNEKSQHLRDINNNKAQKEMSEYLRLKAKFEGK